MKRDKAMQDGLSNAITKKIVPDKKLILITGRSRKQGSGLIKGKGSPEYLEEIGRIDLNRDLMKDMGLKTGSKVVVKSSHGSLTARCAEGDIAKGIAFMPMGALVNRLVGIETWGSGMPEFKGIEIEIIEEQLGS